MIGHLQADLERLLSFQERYDLLYRKWVRRVGRNYCDLAYANAYDGPDTAVVQAIRDTLDDPSTLNLQYSPYGGSTITRRLIAERLSRLHKLSFQWQDVVLTPGAMAALNIVFRGLKTGESDEVIVLTPCWMDYPLYLVNLGLKPVLVPLKRGTFTLDLSSIRKALSPNTRAIVFSQPANPTGVIYSQSELTELADTLNNVRGSKSPIIISDECHREVVYPPNVMTSPTQCYDATIVVYSFGKSLLMQGQRIGYLAISPRFPDRERARLSAERNCRMMGFCMPTALMQVAIRQLLDHEPSIDRLSARRERVLAALTFYGYSVLPSHATFFIYVACPEPDDFSFAERLASRGVFVLPGSVFHDPGYFRISLTASDHMIDSALPVFESAMHEIKRSSFAEVGASEAWRPTTTPCN
ncbi:MAG TPA: aminotransferase class I/II-fold pyridoxal phosphate-dependent enzyme [Terriglobales bacterium]|nr:aminotransferase class I/II-fold pyridoxal phosphate-dependent enzyme [Terriglobales bacterium]